MTWNGRSEECVVEMVRQGRTVKGLECCPKGLGFYALKQGVAMGSHLKRRA